MKAAHLSGGRWRLTPFLLCAIACAPLCGGAASQIQIYGTDALHRIRPHEAAPPPSPVFIKAARNEYEPFQVVVRADSNGLKNATVTISNFRGKRATLNRSNISIYREHYIEVTKASYKSKEGVGWYPDALIPINEAIRSQQVNAARFVGAPFDVPPESNQPIWVDVYVPPETPPGDYQARLTVSAPGRKPASIPIRLKVWNFNLPPTPAMRSNFGGFGQRIAGHQHLQADSAEFKELERRYAEMMAAHRLCPPIPGYLLPATRPDGTIDPTQTHAALKEWMDEFHVTGFPLNLLGNDPLGKDRERNSRYLPAMYSYLRSNGWDKLAYIYVLDEPNDAAAYEEVRKRARFIHETQPGIKVLCTEQPTPQDPAWGTLAGSVDIWVPLWTLFEERAAAERLAAGEELWSYTALCQGAQNKDTPYWEMDFPLLDYRIFTWMSWRFGLRGVLYWTTVYWEKTDDVWTNPRTYGEGSTAFNGEGSLFYPGADAGFAGPVASVRLKQIREGLEDFEYLTLLRQRGHQQFADECAKRLAASWTQWDNNPSHLYSVREEMAAKLEGDTGRGK